MIPLPIRILAISASLGYLLVIVHALRRNRIGVRQAVWWLLSAGVFVTLSIFPGVLVFAGEKLGFVAPSNALFLVWVLGLTILLFHQSMTTSRQTEEIRRLAQALAIERLHGESHE